MLQLMSPAGSPEAVIAAVQSGADIVNMSSGLTLPAEGEDGFSAEQLAQSLRYCRVRGCRTALSLGELCSDETLPQVCRQAVYAAEKGADVLVVRDLGLARALRSLLPNTPLWADPRLDVSSFDAVLSMAALGFSRVTLAPQLGLEEIRAICKNAPIEITVPVHGHLCIARSGSCALSAFSDRPDGGSLSACCDLCRERLDLGGRMDDYPLSTKDLCRIDRLDELSDAGVTCVSIDGHGRSPEFVAFAARLYSRAIRERVYPTAGEREDLGALFSANGLTEAGLSTEADDIFGLMKPLSRDTRRASNELRKQYMNSELRRLSIRFYAIIRPGTEAVFAAEDGRGNRAVYTGFVPVDLGRAGISETRVRDILYRTGGTPYACDAVQCSIAPHLDYPEEAIEEARDSLIAQIAEKNRGLSVPTVGEMPKAPIGRNLLEAPKFICQITRADQLTEELARTDPDYLYIPAELAAANEQMLYPFRERGTRLVAVLPRAFNEAELPEIGELLRACRRNGVTELLGGSLAWLRLSRRLEMPLRGDYALNPANAFAFQTLADAGLLSATVSLGLSAAAIKTLPKVMDTEMIVYGRAPLLVTETCLIRRSAGRCSCQKPVMLQDRSGGQFPVMKEYGCRNVLFDTDKIFLADRPDRFLSSGLWGIRLLFTAENPRECVDVMRRYKYRSDYQPNSIGHGLYAKGGL